MIFLLFGAALLIRLIVAALFFGPWDTESVYVVADLLRKGSLVYNDTWRYSNPPTWLWMIGGLSFLADKTGIPLYFISKVPFILADLGVGFLIYKLIFNLKGSIKKAVFCSSLYLLNPLPILISAYQGQLDSLFLFFVLLSGTILITAKKQNLVNVILSGLTLGIASTIKLIPLGVLPIFLLYLYRSEKIKLRLPDRLLLLFIFSLFTFLPLVLEFIPYLSVGNSIVEHVFRYKTWWSLWGVSLMLREINQIWLSSSIWFQNIIDMSKNQTLSIVLVLTVSYIVVLFKKWSLWKNILFLFLTEYAISSFLAPQYLVWVIPFFILEMLSRGKYLYSFIFYTFLVFLGTGTIYWFWQDETFFHFLGQTFLVNDISSLILNIYAFFMIPAWAITLYWWLRMMKQKN